MPVLELMSKATKPQLKCMLNSLSEDVLDQVCVSVYNCIENAEFDGKEYDKLYKTISKDRKKLQYIVKNVSVRGKDRRKALVQSGGSIGAILSAILPLALSFL